MPCNRSYLITNEFPVKNLDLLEKAALALGLQVIRVGERVSVQTPQGGLLIENGQITGFPSAMNAHANKLKQAYARQVVSWVANKKGWSVQATGLNKVQIQKR